MSSEENGTGIRNDSASIAVPGSDSVSIKCGPPAEPNIEPSPLSDVNGLDLDGDEEMQVDGEADLAVTNQNNHDENGKILPSGIYSNEAKFILFCDLT